MALSELIDAVCHHAGFAGKFVVAGNRLVAGDGNLGEFCNQLCNWIKQVETDAGLHA